MSGKYIPSLNGLRAISILFVILGHLGIRNFDLKDSPGGQLGVNIFFIISGFLITLLLLDEEKTNGSISLKKFYARRTLRIFPVFYFLLLVYLVLQIAGVLYFSANSWITSLTYTKYFPIHNSKEWESEHLWSLSVEEHFYLFWPFIFKYLKPYRVSIAIFIIVLVPVIRGIEFWLNGDSSSLLTLYTRADALMMGCLLALNRERVSDWLYRLVKWNRFAIFLPVIVFFISVVAMKFESVVSHNIYITTTIRMVGRSTGTITTICICLIIMISVNFAKTAWFNFLNTRPMNYIGKLSYSLYIWQQLFFSHHIGFLGRLPLNIFLIAGVSVLSYNFIEKPFLRLKSKFEVQKAPEQAEIRTGIA